MLVDADHLEKQLHDANAIEEAVRRAYLILAYARFRDGTTVRPTGHGYIERELRFEENGDWLYSAVLNQKWVLWYFRKPALSAGLVDTSATRLHFTAAEITARGEVKLRVPNAEGARAVLRWIKAEDGSA